MIESACSVERLQEAFSTFKRRWNSALDEEMVTDPNVFFMSDQVGEYEGAYKAGFSGIIVGSTYHGLKSMIEFMTFNFSMQDLLRFCIKTIWDKGLEREQNVGVPIYGERSDLLISEVGNHVSAAGLRVAAAMLYVVKEASDMTVV
nr:pyruvate dehydrogenase E1 component subunit beta-1, mitochondrial isoform X1 [Tanacetum cinerariifolium]